MRISDWSSDVCSSDLYLFKPQLDRWEERAWRGLPAEVSVSPDAQLASALAANPGASFRFFRLPEAPGDAAVVNIARIDGSIRDVAVGPDGKVLGARNPEERITEIGKAACRERGWQFEVILGVEVA